MPILSGTGLNNYCYANMFSDCTSLTGITDLPATTMKTGCYMGMFSGCTSLETAPVLSATNLVASSYTSMFDGDENLSYIKCLATGITAADCTTNWVRGVADSGTFVKKASMATWTTGDNGIPVGWTVDSA